MRVRQLEDRSQKALHDTDCLVGQNEGDVAFEEMNLLVPKEAAMSAHSFPALPACPKDVVNRDHVKTYPLCATRNLCTCKQNLCFFWHERHQEQHRAACLESLRIRTGPSRGKKVDPLEGFSKSI